MGLVSTVVGLPLAPLRGVIALGRVIQRQVEQEQKHPAMARRELEAAEEARAAGEITPGEEAEVQEQVVDRVTEPEPVKPEKG